MSTTIVLHGGATSKETPKNNDFFSLLTSLPKKQKVRAAMCYWARDRDTWDKVFNRDKEKILRTKSKEIEFILPETPADFFQVINSCDLMYVAGGEAYNIEPLYKNLKDLKKYLDGKIYLGSSMGAFMASQHYVLSSDEKDATKVVDGIGLIDIQCLAHYDIEPEKDRKLALLRNHSKLPILTLDECEFIKFEI